MRTSLSKVRRVKGMATVPLLPSPAEVKMGSSKKTVLKASPNTSLIFPASFLCRRSEDWGQQREDRRSEASSTPPLHSLLPSFAAEVKMGSSEKTVLKASLILLYVPCFLPPMQK